MKNGNTDSNDILNFIESKWTALGFQFLIWTLIGILGSFQNYYLYDLEQNYNFGILKLLSFNLPI